MQYVFVLINITFIMKAFVIVNNIDNTRLDLVIPGQQHMYLRAPSPQDRQKWLVALGSAKACVDSVLDPKGILLQILCYTYEILHQLNLIFVSKGSGIEDSLTHKKSELHLYCDLLMQQVHAMKGAANSEGGPEIQV